MPNCNMEGNAPYNCEGCDLRGKDLRGKDLKRAVFKKANLSGLDLTGLDLTGADLSEAILDGTILTRAVLKDAVLIKTDLSRAILGGANLSKASIGNGTSFARLNLSDAVFAEGMKSTTGAALVNFSGTTLPYAALGKFWNGLDLGTAVITAIPAKLAGLRISKCTLKGWDLHQKSLDNVRFDACNLEDAKLMNTIMLNVGFNNRTNLSRADLTQATLTNIDFETATLTRATLKSAIVSDCTFRNARMDGTIFESCELNSSTFSNPPFFAKSDAFLTSFKNAKIRLSDIQKNWSFLDLTNTTVYGLSKDLTNLIAEGAVLSNWDFRDYLLNNAIFNRAKLDDCKFDKAKLNKAEFRGASGKLVSFTGAELLGSNFSALGDNYERPARFPGADFTRARLTGSILSYAQFGPQLQQNSLFTSAQMEDVGMSFTNLSKADFTGTVLLYKSTFTGAKLEGADLSGAQMGAYTSFFSVMKNREESDFNSLISDLNGNSNNTLMRLFKQKGSFTLNAPSVQVNVRDQVWTVTNGDAVDKTVFSIVRAISSDRLESLLVSRPAVAANFSLADLRSAILKDADMRGMNAAESYFSGETKLAGAKMNGMNLTGAKMNGIDLTEAKMYAANMTNAELIGTNLQSATLQNAIFTSAWLQGAKFQDTDLNGVSLEKAAISMLLENTNAGVYLRTVDPMAAADPVVAQQNMSKLLEEIGQLAVQYMLDIDDAEKLDDEELTGLTFLSTDKITFSARASVTADADKGSWKIQDGSNSYLAWEGETELGNEVIFIRKEETPYCTRFFKSNLDVTLRRHFNIFPISGLTGVWRLDNDAEHSDKEENVVFRLTRLDKKMMVHAIAVRTIEKNSAGQNKYVTETFKHTELCKEGAARNCDPGKDNMVLGPDTVCPNGIKFRENRKNDLSWKEMLRAPLTSK